MFKSRNLYCVIAITLTGCGPEAPAKSETQIKPSDYDSQTYLTCDDFRIDRVDNGLVIIDKKGSEIAKSETERLSRLVGPTSTQGGPDCTDIMPIYSNQMSGFLLPEGKIFANRLFEDTAGLYRNTLAFKENGKWGLINDTGYEILKPDYGNIFWFDSDRWMVSDNDENYFIGMDGKRQPAQDDDYLSLQYGRKHSKRSEYISCPDGTKLQAKNGLWGIVDAENNVVIEQKFRALHCLHDNLSFATNDAKNAWCFVDLKGEFTDEPCKKRHPIYYQHHVLPEKFSEDYYENSVLWMRAYFEFGESARDKPPMFVSDGGLSGAHIAEARHHKYHPMMKL